MTAHESSVKLIWIHLLLLFRCFVQIRLETQTCSIIHPLRSLLEHQTLRGFILLFFDPEQQNHCNIFFNIHLGWNQNCLVKSWSTSNLRLLLNPSAFHGFIMEFTNSNAEFITSQPPAPPAPPWHGSWPHPLGWHRPRPRGRCSRHSKCGLPHLAMGMGGIVL